MDIILTESQYRKILSESYKDKIKNNLSKIHNFTKKVVSDSLRQLNLDFRFLLSYGAGIGALLTPVYDYLSDNFQGLTEEQIAGLSIMAIAVVFFEGKDLKREADKLKEMGLSDELIDAVNYAEKLKTKLKSMLKLLGMSIHRVSNIVSYSFLIPILSILIGVVTKYGMDSEQFNTFVESLLTSGLITVTGVSVRDILFKAAEMIELKKSN